MYIPRSTLSEYQAEYSRASTAIAERTAQSNQNVAAASSEIKQVENPQSFSRRATIEFLRAATPGGMFLLPYANEVQEKAKTGQNNITRAMGQSSAAKDAETQAAADQANWGKIDGYTQPFKAEPNKNVTASLYDLKPAGSGLLDVVKDFSWTKSSYRDEVPRLRLKELKVEGMQQVNYYNQMIGLLGDSINPFTISSPDFLEGLYKTNPTGFSYIFPYYADETVNSGNGWSEKIPTDADYLAAGKDIAGMAVSGVWNMLKGIAVAKGRLAAAEAMDGAGNVAGKVASGASNVLKDAVSIGARTLGGAQQSPYAGVEQPMYFSGGSKGKYTISFPLFNTTSLVEIRRNYDFIRLFQYQNLFTRTSLATYNPPVIYVSETTGDHASPIGRKFLYVSQFTVKNLGAIRSIDLQNGSALKVAIPEAYQVTIFLNDIITNSRNMFSSTMSNNGSSIVRTVDIAQNNNSTGIFTV